MGTSLEAVTNFLMLLFIMSTSGCAATAAGTDLCTLVAYTLRLSTAFLAVL
jgi:hypothetical protein